jgi:hypothetical protein
MSPKRQFGPLTTVSLKSGSKPGYEPARPAPGQSGIPSRLAPFQIDC